MGIAYELSCCRGDVIEIDKAAELATRIRSAPDLGNVAEGNSWDIFICLLSVVH